ncbi:MAG: hypothetical protein EHM70_14030, partial [Chloroflexota bacterium]
MLPLSLNPALGSSRRATTIGTNFRCRDDMPDTWIENFAKKIPLPAYQALVRREVIGLCYHAVSAEAQPHLDHLIPHKTASMFEQDLLFLKEHFQLISYEELLAHRAGNLRLRPNSILLTFDDGYSECYSVVRPLLLKYEIPAIFFLITSCIDNREMYFRNKVSLCIDAVLKMEPD